MSCGWSLLVWSPRHFTLDKSERALSICTKAYIGAPKVFKPGRFGEGTKEYAIFVNVKAVKGRPRLYSPVQERSDDNLILIKRVAEGHEIAIQRPD